MLKPLLITLTLSQMPELNTAKDPFLLPEEKAIVIHTMSYDSQEKLIKQNEKIIELMLKQMIEENK